MFILNNEGILGSHVVGEWFNGKTAAFKVADLGSNPCSPVVVRIKPGYL